MKTLPKKTYRLEGKHAVIKIESLINRKEIKTEEDNEIKIVQESLFKLLNLLLLNYLSLHHSNLLCIKSSHS